MKRVLQAIELLACIAIFSGITEKVAFGNPGYGIESTSLVYNITVVHKNKSVAYASVLCILNSGKEIFLECDQSGNTEIETIEPIIRMCGVVRGFVGVVLVEEPGEIKISVKKVKQPGRNRTKVARLGTFAVYETDSNGDAKFRYLGTVNRYYCASHLPILGLGKNSPYPQNWDKEDISYPNPWKGKKLYVPRWYQWYHEKIYGYSISRALFLVADY